MTELASQEHREPLVVNVHTKPERRHGWLLKGGALAAAAAVGASAMLAVFGRLPGFEVEKKAKMKSVIVKKIGPIEIDCRARTVVAFEDEAKVGLAIVHHAIGSTESRAHTIGEAETLSCVHAKNVQEDVSQTGEHSIFIPSSSITFYSRINEDKTLSHIERGRAAKMGRAEWEAAAAAGMGTGINRQLSVSDGLLVQASRIYAVNFAQQQCGSQMWGITEQVIQQGYRMAAQGQGIDPNSVHVYIQGGSPDFTGPYELPKHFKYQMNGDPKAPCTLAPDAYTPVLIDPPDAAHHGIR